MLSEMVYRHSSSDSPFVVATAALKACVMSLIKFGVGSFWKQKHKKSNESNQLLDEQQHYTLI